MSKFSGIKAVELLLEPLVMIGDHVRLMTSVVVVDGLMYHGLPPGGNSRVAGRLPSPWAALVPGRELNLHLDLYLFVSKPS